TCGEGDELLALLRTLEPLDVHEIVVAAVSESAQTRRAALGDPRLRWLDCASASRGEQLNRAAGKATGDLLVFLHADTRLPKGALPAVARALSEEGVAGGAFRVRFDTRHAVLDLLARLSASTWPATYFGDQVLFCRRRDFEAAGGFAAVPILEDVDLAWKLARRGRLVRIADPVTTSARRFTKAGTLRQLGRNARLLLLHYLGLPTRAAAAGYRPNSNAREPDGNKQA
ncbi:MAG: glycosyltransferase, partial [Candidatus Eisenbacteria bacterium]